MSDATPSDEDDDLRERPPRRLLMPMLAVIAIPIALAGMALLAWLEWLEGLRLLGATP